MIKKSLYLLVLLLCLGCAYEGQEFQKFIDNSKTLLRDPHFSEYKQKRDDLEREYLQKQITYAEYVEKRDKLDLIYAKEVQERTKIIESQE